MQLFVWTIYGLIDCRWATFLWNFCCFSLFIILSTWKIYIFTFLFCFWNEVIFSLMFLSLIMLICQWMSEFNLRTVRAIAKARKIVQISICVFNLQWYVYVILSKKIKMTVSFLKECYSFSGVSLYLWWCIVEKKV